MAATVWTPLVLTSRCAQLRRTLSICHGTLSTAQAAGGRALIVRSASTIALPARAEQLDNGMAVIPLSHGRIEGPGGGLEIAEAIRRHAPRQVLVELCASRYTDVLASAVLGVQAGPPPRLDILGNIHGGTLTHELGPVIAAAREVGAAIVPIDRPRSATRSRVAQRLWHPKLLQGILRYGSLSIRLQRRGPTSGLTVDDVHTLHHELQKSCSAAFQILVEERCSYLAHQARAVAVTRPGGSKSPEVIIVCGVLHSQAVADALRREKPEDINLARLAERTVPVWPLYVFAYAIIPATITGYFLVSAWNSFVAPSLSDDGGGDPMETAQSNSQAHR